MDQNTINILFQHIEFFFNNLDFVVLAVIVLHMLVGFFRGTRKSTYYLITTFITFGVALIFMDPLVDLMMKVDFSSLNQTVGTVPLTNVYDTVLAFVGSITNLGDGIKDLFSGEYTQEFIIGLVTFLVKIVYLLVTFILSITLYKIIYDFIWLKFRPKKNINTNIRPKPSMKSRIGGALIDGAKSLLFYGVVYFFLFSGLLSIADEVKVVVDNNTSTSITVNNQYESPSLFRVSNNLSDYNYVIQIDNNELPDNIKNFFVSLEPYMEYVELADKYHGTVIESIYNTIQIDNKPLTNAVFDDVFSIDTKNTKVILREEIINSIDLVQKEEVIDLINELNTNPISTSNLSNYCSYIKDVLPLASTSNLLKSVLQVGVELGTNYIDFLGSSQSSDYQKIFTNNKSLDQVDIIANLTGCIDLAVGFMSDYGISDFSNFDVNILFTAENATKTQNLINKIQQLSVIDYVSPSLINLLLNSSALDTTLSSIGLTKDALKTAYSSSSISFSKELSNIPSLVALYSANKDQLDKVLSLDFSSFDSNTITALRSLINQSKESELLKTTLNNALKEVIKNLLKTTFGDKVDLSPLDDIKDWITELEVLLDAVNILINSNIFIKSNPLDDQYIITNLLTFISTQEVINTNVINDNDTSYAKFIKTISNSNLFSALFNLVFMNAGTVFNTLGVLPDIEFPNFAKTNFDVNEYSALFGTISSLIPLINGLTNQTIDINTLFTTYFVSNDGDLLLTNLSKSKLITNNLDSLIKDVIGSFIATYLVQAGLIEDSDDIKFYGLTNSSNWTNTEWKQEFSSTITAAGSIMGLVNGMSAPGGISSIFENMDTNDLSTKLSNSYFITNNSSTITEFIATFLNTSLNATLSDSNKLELTGLKRSKTLEWTKNDWKNEYKALFDAASSFLTISSNPSGFMTLLSASAPIGDEEESDEYKSLKSLISGLSSSAFIRSNFVPLIKYAFGLIQLGDIELSLTITAKEFSNYSDYKQTKEISNLLWFVNAIINKNILSSANPIEILATFTESDIESITKYIEKEAITEGNVAKYVDNSTLLKDILASILNYISSLDGIKSFNISFNIKDVTSWKTEFTTLINLIGSLDDISSTVTNALSTIDSPERTSARTTLATLITEITNSKLLEPSIKGLIDYAFSNIPGISITLTKDDLTTIKNKTYTSNKTGWVGELDIVFYLYDNMDQITSIDPSNALTMMTLTPIINKAFEGVLTKNIIVNLLRTYLSNSSLNIVLTDNDVKQIDNEGWINNLTSVLNLLTTFTDGSGFNFTFNETQENALKASVQYTIGKKAIVALVNSIISSMNASTSITQSDINKIEKINNGWNIEIETLFDIVNDCPSLINGTFNQDSLDPDTLSTLMVTASNGIITTKILGTIMNSFNLGPDFTNQDTLKTLAPSIKTLFTLYKSTDPTSSLDIQNITPENIADVLDVVSTLFTESTIDLSDSSIIKSTLEDVLGIDLSDSSKLSQFEEILDNTDLIKNVLEQYNSSVDPSNFDVNDIDLSSLTQEQKDLIQNNDQIAALLEAYKNMNK